MRMALDPGDVLGEGCWETLKRVLILWSMLCGGCVAALLSLGMARVVDAAWAGAWSEVGKIMFMTGKSMLWAVFLGPFYYVFTLWGIVLVPLLGLTMYLMMRAERDVTWIWVGMVVLTGGIVMGNVVGVPGKAEGALAWMFFLFVLVSLGVGVFLLRGWQRNTQARHLQEVMAENEMRREGLKQRYGTSSFGQGTGALDDVDQ